MSICFIFNHNHTTSTRRNTQVVTSEEQAYLCDSLKGEEMPTCRNRKRPYFYTSLEICLPQKRRNTQIHNPKRKGMPVRQPLLISRPQKRKNTHTTTSKEKESLYTLKMKGIRLQPQKKRNNYTTAKRDGIHVQPQIKRYTSTTSKEKECPSENISG